MSETDSHIDDFEMNSYTVTVPILLNEFNSYEELELTVAETAAKSIANTVDHFEASDASYIATKVSCNSEELEAVFDEDPDDVEVLNVEAIANLGVLTN